MQEPTTTITSAAIECDARTISDSRGRPTVEVELRVNGVKAVGDVPAGASKGEDEAQTVPVEKALTQITEQLLPLLREKAANLTTSEGLFDLEHAMQKAAGDNYQEIGANAVLPMSRALWRLCAKLQNKPLHQFITEIGNVHFGDPMVMFYMNIFNGGLHALKEVDGEKLGVDRIDIQEIMVVPVGANSYAAALEAGEKIDQTLKTKLIAGYGEDALTRGDEAGFTVKGLGDSSKAFSLVMDAIRDSGFEPGRDVKLALDVAASSFYDAKREVYRFRDKDLSTDEMVDYLVALVDEYPNTILSIEDGLGENDWAGWQRLTKELSERDVITIGDDLFVTQMPRLQKGIELRAATGILVKVNQNGSVSGTLEVMRHAKSAGMKAVISHRSGETLDDSIADLAVGTGAFGLKTGDPQPEVDFPEPKTWVRRRKYLRMLEIENER